MSECTDKNIGKLLGLYELNLLSEDRKAQFEMHLYDCSYCMEEVKNFAASSDILNNDPEISDIVKSETFNIPSSANFSLPNFVRTKSITRSFGSSIPAMSINKS